MSSQPDPIRTGGEAVVQSLLDHGVDTVFGIPGIQLDPLFDAFYAKRNALRVLHTRHEQGAAFMAMGYAQSSGRDGVFAVVPGPGILNSLTALATAEAANLPVLGLTGQIPSDQIGQGYGGTHELKNQLAVIGGVIDWIERANHPAEAPALLARAFQAMRGGRPSTAVFEMAPDNLSTSAPVPPLAPLDPLPIPDPDPRLLEKMAAQLAAAERPAIFVGSGVFGAEDQLRALAEKLQAPVVHSPTGLGALSAEHPLAHGMLSGQEIWQDIDAALVVGTRFITPALAWGRENEVPVLRIDIDPSQIRKPRPAAVGLVTSAAKGLEALNGLIAQPGGGDPAFLARCDAIRAAVDDKLAGLEPLAGLSKAVRNALPDDGILVTDVTQLAYFARYGFPVRQPRTFLLPAYQATLGWAYPAALGAKVANPGRKVVAICGDGGFMFTVQELATAVQHGIAVVVIVCNNDAYGNVKTIQAESYGARHIAVDLINPDFVALAKAFGMRAERAENAAALEESLTRLLAAEVPALIEVPLGEVPNIWNLVRRPPSQGKAPR